MTMIGNSSSLRIKSQDKALLFIYGITILTSILGVSPYVYDLFCIFFLLSGRAKLGNDRLALLLFLFSIVYVLNSLLFGEVPSASLCVSYLLAPLAFYCFGKYLVVLLENDNHYSSFWLWSIILYEGLLVVLTFYDVQSNGIVNIERTFDNVSFLSTGSATGYGAMSTFGIIGIPVFFSVFKSNKKKGILFLVIGLLSLLCSVHFVNRTALFICLICIAIMLLYLMRGKSSAVLWMVLIIAALVYFENQGGIVDDEIIEAYEDRNKGDSSIMTGGSRVVRWIDGCHNLFRYPFGWINEKTEFYSVHNMWLDIARWGGIFAFFISVIFTLRASITTIKMYSQKNNEIVAIILSLNICLFLSCFVEPILIGMPSIFYLYCMVWGFQNDYYKKIKTSSI